MKALIAVDSFKGSASSTKLNHAIAQKLQQLDFISKTFEVPIADGGEGSLSCIKAATGGEIIEIPTEDLLGRTINARVLSFISDGEQQVLIESADIMGLNLVNPSTKTVETANTKGLGILLKKLIQQGFEKIIITLGGTGVTDGGLGVLHEFGAKFFNSENKEITQGNFLLSLSRADLTNLNIPNIDIIIATDVTNPYCGKEGAFHIFSKQKGASEEQIEIMDANAKKISDEILLELDLDLNKIPGAGAAGGLGAALTVLKAKMENGFKLISKLIHFEEKIKQTDIVITGEGCIDDQSLFGKTPYAIAELAEKYRKPVIAICGKMDITEKEVPFSGIFSIQKGPVSIKEATEKVTTLKNAADTVFEVLKTAYQIAENGGI